jgi:small-conductance mechanosensitive channel
MLMGIAPRRHLAPVGALAVLLYGVLTAGAVPAARAAVAAPPEVEIATAPVEMDGSVLFRVRGTSSFPADQRAAAIQGRIEAAARDRRVRPEDLRTVESGDAIAIMAGERALMGVFDADARLEQLTPADLARAHRERIRSAIQDYRRAREPEALLRNGVYAVVATVALAATLLLLRWLARRLDALIARRLRHHIHGLGIQSFQILRAEHIWASLRAALRVARVVVVLALVIPYLRFVLEQFPWTRARADQLTQLVAGPLKSMGEAALGHIPAVLFLVILFVVLRFVLQAIRLFFDAVERGSVTLAGFEPEWAQPSYKLARLAVVALGVVVAYPYIPGSESAAFKGVSLFLGVIFSLGSSSTISNVIAGYVMTYRRAFRLGDRVKIGDVLGDVIEMRLQVTHVRSLKNEEVIVPNSLILNSQVVNYSSLAGAQGLILHTAVGIGYETPWRQVEAMLLMAAARTPGLAPDPRPFVLQLSLGDFAVTYELNVYCRDAKLMMPLYTALHRNILDVFNEYGVQIMTPAYEMDPKQPKLVPREQWYTSPAAGDGEAAARPPAAPT